MTTAKQAPERTSSPVDGVARENELRDQDQEKIRRTEAGAVGIAQIKKMNGNSWKAPRTTDAALLLTRRPTFQLHT